MCTGVPLMSLSGRELFLAFLAGECLSWIVQMCVINVFLKAMLFTENPIAMFTSVCHALMNTLFVLFQV